MQYILYCNTMCTLIYASWWVEANFIILSIQAVERDKGKGKKGKGKKKKGKKGGVRDSSSLD